MFAFGRMRIKVLGEAKVFKDFVNLTCFLVKIDINISANLDFFYLFLKLQQLEH